MKNSTGVLSVILLLRGAPSLMNKAVGARVPGKTGKRNSSLDSAVGRTKVRFIIVK